MASKNKVIRYAVVGLGYFAQIAVLPAFKNAKKNSKLVALFSDDPKKLRVLGKKYKTPILANYDRYEEVLRSGEVDAVYIVLPNSMHREFAERAAICGVDVLCEKPMAVSSGDCESMIETCESQNRKLMIAYRLHFEETNLSVAKLIKSGKIGDPRFFSSTFSMQVKKGNIRLNGPLGGGTLYDIGIYCLNAARNIFRAEPTEVLAFSEKSQDPRFKEVDEMTSVILRFPENRLATFTSSFGSADTSKYEVVGTKGSIKVDPAFEFASGLKYELTIGEKVTKKSFSKRDQVAPEILYFSECILKNRKPEPSGKEGLADVRIIEALYESAEKHKAIKLSEFRKTPRPTMEQEIQAPANEKQPLVNAQTPH